MREVAEMMRFVCRVSTLKENRTYENDPCRRREGSAGQLPQELLLIQSVLEGFAAVDEDNRDFVGELPAQLVIGLHVHFTPAESAPAFQLGELLFYDFAKMAPLARVHDDVAK